MLGISLVILVIVMIIGVPISLAITGGTLIYYTTNQNLPTQLVFQAFITGVESFPLLAIPFFLLAGEIMNATGMTTRLFRLAEALVGHLVGGLGHVNVMTNTLMGGLSGSSNADAAALSKVLVPEMEKKGYDKSWSSALTAVGSVIGPIIPPGISLILFGLLADVSIGQLFIGGIIPGILLCLALMITVHISSKKRGYKPSRDKMASLREIWSCFKSSILALILPIVIIGGIRFGIFTTTEAAAMAVCYALLVGIFVYKTFKWKQLFEVLASTVKTNGIIMLILAAAASFGRMLSWERVPQRLASVLGTVSSNPYIIIFIILIVLLVLGCFTEGTANLIIMTPLIMPIVNNLGINPVAFGVAMVLCLTIGGATPPFGTMMYTVCSINKISIMDYTKQSWPFLMTVIIVLFLIAFMPFLVTFLPNLLM